MRIQTKLKYWYLGEKWPVQMKFSLSENSSTIKESEQYPLLLNTIML